jgi:hypothetical protein
MCLRVVVNIPFHGGDGISFRYKEVFHVLLEAYSLRIPFCNRSRAGPLREWTKCRPLCIRQIFIRIHTDIFVLFSLMCVVCCSLFIVLVIILCLLFLLLLIVRVTFHCSCYFVHCSCYCSLFVLLFIVLVTLFIVLVNVHCSCIVLYCSCIVLP